MPPRSSQYTQQSFEPHLDELLTHAASQFKLYGWRCRSHRKGWRLLDKAMRAGIGDIRNADGNEIKIEHAGQDYAVATPVNGKDFLWRPATPERR
ncbi:MAG: hypothetical protein U1E47_05235 [Rivihabitans pingtungensis]